MIHLRTLQALEYPKVIHYLASFCVSAQGKQKALSLLPYPTEDEARAELSLLDDARCWMHSPQTSKNPPDLAVPDVGPLLSAIENNAARPDTDSFWALRVVLTSAINARAAIIVTEGLTEWPRLYAITLERELPDILQKALTRCISDDATLRDESSAELHRVRNEIRSLHRHCLGRVREFATKYNILAYLQDEFMTISQDRYVLPLKATYKGRLQGILHDWSQTGETCYFEPMFLVQLNNRLQELKREERAEEMRVLDSLTAQVVGERDRVENAVALLTMLDILAAKKKFAEELSATTVAITEESEGLHLVNARHPLLAIQSQEKNSKQNVHPLDICLRPGDQCLLLTGGNAGGKTVCLKTLGLVCAMTASGLPAPVDPGSHIFWIDRLDAFIGDEQDVQDHVSTFTAQIEHLAKAWKYLHEKSLVLLDEFGAGTDPTHGAALAQAVLESLLERGACVLAATHFPTLKIWAMAADHVRAASMLFDPQSKRPLYRLAYDQVGQSQTLTVARDHGLAPEILAKAEKILLLAGNDAADHLERLNAITVERENEIKKLKALQKKTEADAKNKTEKLEKARREIDGELTQSIAQLMQMVKTNKMQAKEALAELKAQRAKLRKEKQEEPEKQMDLSLETLSPGMRVRHTALNRTGTVTDIDERKGRVHVDLGGITLWATRDVLMPAHAGKTDQSPHPVLQDGFSLEIDVRGMTSEEAIQAIERFLDKNTLAGLYSVTIVHGRGTGVLRRAVHNYLKTYPGIESFTLAPEDQGGDGKTIVTFA
ncbi:MAG: Smr/MutS family protein [Desulfovibrionaceae bacterium]|nr:Smr/MutS family protein [Desulfovibrionaceae bacterium]